MLFLDDGQARAAPVSSDSVALPLSVPAQNQLGDPGHLFLLPVTASPVKLRSHAVDVAIQVEADQPIFTVKATYRLHNPSKESVSIQLQVIPARSQLDPPLPQAISLSVDGQALALQPTEQGVQQTTQVTMAADGWRQFVLGYRIPVMPEPLPAFRYPMSALSGWTGALESWRMTIAVPGEGSGLLPAESWIATEPAGWTYDGSRVQWLGEGAGPAQITLQFIHPGIWRELRENRRLSVTEPTLERFLSLGDLYGRLYGSVALDGETYMRFYAQALAAYADGVSYAQQVNAPAADIAPLHRALTALYRSRTILPDGNLDYVYVDLLVDEAQKALAAFPPTDERRQEVAQWLAEGLRLQLRRAEQIEDWLGAFTILEQMESLPSSLVDPTWLAMQRQVVQMQQALHLFDQGSQDAAIALAGPDMLDEAFLPRPEHRALFASWQIVLVLQPDGLDIEAVVHPVSGRENLAHQIYNQLEQAWQGAGATGVESAILEDGSVRIRLDNLSLAQRLALAQATPAIADWALLRTLLVNLEPTVQRRNQLIWQEIEMTQRLDLRSVAEQWRGIAALLERQAAETLVAPATVSTSLNEVQAQLREQLRQIYHRQEAQTWQDLARSSTVRVQAQAAADPTAPSRVWIVQVADPAQSLNFHAQTLSLVRLVLLIMAVLVMILALAGVLWLLL